KPAGAKIELTATRKDNEISVQATYSDVAKTGDTIHLRFVLADERVRFAGGNGLRYHHYVARSDIKGFAVSKKNGVQAATFNLDTIRTQWSKFVEDVTGDADAPRPDRLIALTNLRVVALIQDDESNEVLQAVQIEVK